MSDNLLVKIVIFEANDHALHDKGKQFAMLLGRKNHACFLHLVALNGKYTVGFLQFLVDLDQLPVHIFEGCLQLFKFFIAKLAL
ncbi:MAG: hypothetical protein ACD_39C00889G0001 [uncultured bacterium]|nr:MAG: hypothetical protein ACD_39C00889G0001 [uncultured bacterium]